MIRIIVAIAKNNVIGKTGEMLPWHIPEDLKLFKKHTTGNVIIMGRKTYESIGRPLPNRENIIISSTLSDQEGLIICRSLEEAVEKAKSFDKDIYIVGGANIYAQSLSLADELYISHIKKEYEGNIEMPHFSLDQWQKTTTESYPEFDFCIYSRQKVSK